MTGWLNAVYGEGGQRDRQVKHAKDILTQVVKEKPTLKGKIIVVPDEQPMVERDELCPRCKEIMRLRTKRSREKKKVST